jgi:uncharacterized membrane protein
MRPVTGGAHAGPMGELLICVFDGETSASRALREMRASGGTPATIASAGSVSVGGGGTFEVQTTDRPGSRGGFSGIFWEALFGLVFIVHVPGSSYGPKTGALFETISHAGVDDEFRSRAREALTPGTSAVGLLSGDDEVQAVLTLMGPYHARIVRTSLSSEQDQELDRELGRIA